MTPQETVKLLMSISAAYPYYAKEQAKLDKKNRDATIKVWATALPDIDFTSASIALAKHIRINKYAPSPAEIIELTGADEIIGTDNSGKLLYNNPKDLKILEQQSLSIAE